ncbi:MAG TPA: CNNM domain-containing protein [Verrucomicrobiota bacterium]|nr:hypothetical protein [Verrucomicrobiales bacterium]HRI15042.1 CNNM domain-containing protein [Verrucomicrobiota bacterium]
MSQANLQLIALGFALCLSAFLSGQEAAAMALSRLRIRQWVRENRAGARVLQRYLDRPENFLWTILVGNTLANFVVVTLVVAWAAGQFSHRPAVFWLVLALAAVVLNVIVDFLPKALCRMFPNRLALRFVWPFRVVHGALSPVVALVEGFAAMLLQWTGGRAAPAQLFGNRDELRALVLDSGSGLSTTERTLIHRVLELQYRTVGQIARPLSLADSVNVTTLVTDLLRICREQGHTRLPVWGSGREDARIVGVVSLKNVLYDDPASGRTTVGEYLLPALFLEETLRLEDALRRLQRGGMPFAIVVDATRRERGFVTLSDVLSGVFGEVAL